MSKVGSVEKHGACRAAGAIPARSVRRNLWANTRKGGRAVLRSPEGRIYYGTAAEVTGAGLSPLRRGMLADGLRSLHHAFAVGSIGADDLRECAASKRRDAIREGGYDLRIKHWVGLFPLRDLLRIRAAARLAGVDADEFVESLTLAAVEDAESRCGGRLPFTRQEAAALARC